jgi:hypothetical protein
VIYQGTLYDGRWLGFVDFLLRVERPSEPGGVVVRGGGRQADAGGEGGGGAPDVRLLGDARGRRGRAPEHIHLYLGGPVAAAGHLPAGPFRGLSAGAEAALPGAPGRRPGRAARGPRAGGALPDLRLARPVQAGAPGGRPPLPGGGDRRGPAAGAPRGRRAHAGGAGRPPPGPASPGAPGRLLPADPGAGPGPARGPPAERPPPRAPPPGDQPGRARPLGLAALPAPTPHDWFFDFEGADYAYDEGLEYLWGISDTEDGFRGTGPSPRMRRRPACSASCRCRASGGGAPRRAHLPLRPLRAHGAQAAGGALRRGHRGAGPAPHGGRSSWISTGS